MRKLFIFIAIILVISSVIYRWIQILPFGTGDEAVSPDGRYKALVTRWYEESFFVKSLTKDEFIVEQVSNSKVVQKLIMEPIPNAIFGSRTDTEVIFWAGDSTEVVYVFPEVEIKIKIP